MALAQIKFKVGSKGRATKHFNYIMREDEYEKILGGNDNDQVLYKSFGNMPSWAKDNPKLFWQSADEFERANGTAYREHIFALPRELEFEENLNFINDWIKQELGDKHPYQFAIHTKKALDGEPQPHVHLMYSDRMLDGFDRSPDTFFKRANHKNPEKGGAKKHSPSKTYTERRLDLKEKRNRWGDLLNHHLEMAGLEVRVDMRNWKEKGLSQKPRNLTMQQMNNPDIKQAYVAELDIKAQLKQQSMLLYHHENMSNYERQAQRAEAERLARIQAERLEADKKEALRIVEQQRQAYKLEQARLEAQRQAQLEAEKQEALRIVEQQRQAYKLEQARLEAERLEKNKKFGDTFKELLQKIQNYSHNSSDYVEQVFDLIKDNVLGVSNERFSSKVNLGVGSQTMFELSDDGRLGVRKYSWSSDVKCYRINDIFEIDGSELRVKQTDVKYDRDRFNPYQSASIIDSFNQSEKWEYETPPITQSPNPVPTPQAQPEKRNDYDSPSPF